MFAYLPPKYVLNGWMDGGQGKTGAILVANDQFCFKKIEKISILWLCFSFIISLMDAQDK